ncbi:hypothetical protein [Nitrobacter sp.]|uniref:hypothetical protein n=1 Tax=Nitrobacter sp. TaxID=29420 RepID=UPI00321FFF05
MIKRERASDAGGCFGLQRGIVDCISIPQLMAGFDREGIASFQADDGVSVDRLIFITQRACLHGVETGA